MKKFLFTCFGEVCYSCSLTVLPGSACVVLIYVLQRNFFTSVQIILFLTIDDVVEPKYFRLASDCMRPLISAEGPFLPFAPPRYRNFGLAAAATNLAQSRRRAFREMRVSQKEGSCRNTAQHTFAMEEIQLN